MMGGAYEGRDEKGRLLFEFFPNRPDLLSPEGLARACRAFFDVRPGLCEYDVTDSSEEVRVDSSVLRIRPFLGFARLEGLRFDRALLDGLIELQERLTSGPGRRRKKVAVGIHDADPVEPPYTYRAVDPEGVRFVPLGMDRELTPRQILLEHEKGRLFGDLLKDAPTYPVIEDKEGRVLSLPPIINGQLTALTLSTRNVLVDVTGTDPRAVSGILNILATSLAERGGKIRSLVLSRGGNKTRTPLLAPQTMKLGHARVKELLGLELDGKDLAACLRRMGHDVRPASARQSTVESPAWRLDLLHEDDLVEDVGIGYGFERFQPRLPSSPQFARLRPSTHQVRRARTLLLGMGFTEVITLTLTGPRDSFHNLGAAPRPAVEVENPLSLDQSLLRATLLPSLLGILRANKHRELPQSIFEVGVVVPPNAEAASPANELRAGGVRTASRATLAECKSLVEAFLRDAGVPARTEAGHPPGFIPGRAGILQRNGREIGFFGEIHPKTLESFELGAPAFAFEIAL